MPRVRQATIHRHHDRFGDTTVAWTPTTPKNSLTTYFIKHGVDHLIQTERIDDATNRLLELNYMGHLLASFSDRIQPMAYWRTVGLERARDGYAKAVQAARVTRKPRQPNEISPTKLIAVTAFLNELALDRESRSLMTRLSKWNDQSPGKAKAKQISAALEMLTMARDAKSPAPQRLVRVETSLVFFEEELGPIAPMVLVLRRAHSLLLLESGEPTAAEAGLETLLHVYQANENLDHGHRSLVYRDLASIKARRKDPEAPDLMRQAAEASTIHHGENSIKELECRQKLGAILLNYGQEAEGLDVLNTACEVALHSLGLQDSLSLLLLRNLGDYATKKGEHAKAAQYRWKELQGGTSLASPAHPSNQARYKRLRVSLTRSQDTEGLASLYRWRVEIHAERDGIEHKNTLNMTVNLAWLLLGQHKPKEAKELFESLAISWARKGESDWKLTWAEMGVLFCETAMSGTGTDKARVALERLEAALGAEDRKVVAGRNRLEAILQTVLPAEEG